MDLDIWDCSERKVNLSYSRRNTYNINWINPAFSDVEKPFLFSEFDAKSENKKSFSMSEKAQIETGYTCLFKAQILYSCINNVFQNFWF